MQEAVPNEYPFFPFYAADFDTDTRGMSHGAVGAYIRLLISQWINGELLDDPKQLHRIAGTETQEQFDELWEEIERKFAADEYGTLHNLRLEQERSKAEKITNERRKAGIKSGQARRKQSADQRSGTLDLTTDEQTAKHSQSQSHSHRDKREASPPLPDGLNREAWDDWVANRKECKRKPYTPRSIKTQTRKLAEMSDQEQRDLIDYSIANQYQGIVWDRIGGNHGRREIPVAGAAVERAFRNQRK